MSSLRTSCSTDIKMPLLDLSLELLARVLKYKVAIVGLDNALRLRLVSSGS